MSAATALPLATREMSGAGRRLHVLTLTPFFPSAQNPAQGCFIAEPVERLPRFDIESRVIAINPFYRSSQDTCVAGSEWKKYYCVPGNVGLVTSGTLLARAIRTRVLDLHHSSPIRMIHAHTALPCGEAAMVLAKELNIPFAVSVHGIDVFAEKQAGKWLARWTKQSTMRVYREANSIVCISEKVREQLPDELRERTRVIYNGVDHNLFKAVPESLSRLRILSVGNLIAIKDHALLLRALVQTLRTLPNVQLDLIGDGPERSSFGQGIEEIIDHGKNGLLVPPGDEVALSNTLSLLLQDAELRRKLGTAARDTILKGHTLEHQAQQLAGVYQETVI